MSEDVEDRADGYVEAVAEYAKDRALEVFGEDIDMAVAAMGDASLGLLGVAVETTKISCEAVTAKQVITAFLESLSENMEERGYGRIRISVEWGEEAK